MNLRHSWSDLDALESIAHIDECTSIMYVHLIRTFSSKHWLHRPAAGHRHHFGNILGALGASLAESYQSHPESRGPGQEVMKSSARSQTTTTSCRDTADNMQHTV